MANQPISNHYNDFHILGLRLGDVVERVVTTTALYTMNHLQCGAENDCRQCAAGERAPFKRLVLVCPIERRIQRENNSQRQLPYTQNTTLCNDV